MPVYDIEMPSEHNFVLENGTVAHNCSHAVCYSIIGYACAWLRHHYPLEWWCAVMANASKKEIKEHFWKECGHLIDLPDVNRSQDNFSIVGDRIIAPLSLVKGIGDSAHQQLCAGRPYKDIQDFCNKIEEHKKTGAHNALNNGIVPNLILTGVMDSLFPSGMTVIDKFNEYGRATAIAAGKKKVERNEKCEELAKANAYQRYQVIKELMPEFSMPLMKLMADRGEPGVTVDDEGRYSYMNEIHGKLSRYRLVDIEELEAAIEAMPWIDGGYTVAVAAYVAEDRRFSFVKDGKKKNAASLTMDIEGAHREYVMWSDKSGELPYQFKDNSFTGTIVVAILEKYREDKPFSIKDLVLVQPSLKQVKESNNDTSRNSKKSKGKPEAS